MAHSGLGKEITALEDIPAFSATLLFSQIIGFYMLKLYPLLVKEILFLFLVTGLMEEKSSMCPLWPVWCSGKLILFYHRFI